MTRLIDILGNPVADVWTLVAKDNEFSSLDLNQPLILPLALWLEHESDLIDQPHIGVWLDSDEAPELLGQKAARLKLIAVNFPVFTDGRGYSIARLLRERFAFQGELRAIGDVLLDQLFYMKRCGFDRFVLRADKDINHAASCLNSFNEVYQAAVVQKTPLFRRRA